MWASLNDEQLADIDARILAGRIIEAIRSIKDECGVSLREAMDLNRARYHHLRAERGAEFACGDGEYWSGYSECPFDAMSRGPMRAEWLRQRQAHPGSEPTPPCGFQRIAPREGAVQVSFIILRQETNSMLASLRIAVIAFLMGAALVGLPAVGADEPKFITFEELDKLPEGIKVVHEPKTALATLSDKSERRGKYTWWYKTTVSAIDGDVTITEFGAFAWKDEKWVHGGTFTGKPYATAEFAEWYKCPMAILKKGESFSDPTNWSSDAELRAGKMRWYFVGVDAQGKKVKGEAVIELKGVIDPQKPKDPE